MLRISITLFLFSIVLIGIAQNKIKSADSLLNYSFKKEIAARILLYEISKKKKDLESIYYYDQINKANLLSINDEKAEAGNPVNSKVLLNQIPSLESVKKTLDENTALLSYHLSEPDLITFVITKNSFTYVKNPINYFFNQRIDSLCKMIYRNSSAPQNQISIHASELYTLLIAPIQQKLSSVKRIIIIPDAELLSLPFDILLDSDNKYLIEKFSIQYLYSTALLLDKKQTLNDQSTLAFTPFSKSSYTDSTIYYPRLSESEKEVKNLPGELYSDSSATKQNFLTRVNSHGILHLATYSLLDNKQPMQSYIAFYPTQNDSIYKLYVNEIYKLHLDSTRLVILSAAQTMYEQSEKSKGLLNLCNAFKQAGCSNIITSLWKANDQSTSIILSKLHYYLSRGFSPDVALQKAKIDLLRNTTLDQNFKLPSNWANFVSIGNYYPIKHGLQWRWVAFSTILMMLLYYFTKKRVRNQFQNARNN